MIKKMEAAKPSLPVGGPCQYHGVTFAWLVGEIIQRISGKSFREVIHDEVVGPLGIEKDLFFGTTEQEDVRFAPPVPCKGSTPNDWRRMFIMSDAIRHACVPSANCLTNARTLAKIYASLLPEGADGVKLLKQSTVDNATFARRAADDPVPEGRWDVFGLGYALPGAGFEKDRGRFFGHGGALGAEGVADKETGIAIGFTKNQCNTTHPVHPIRNEISRILGIPERIW